MVEIVVVFVLSINILVSILDSSRLVAVTQLQRARNPTSDTGSSPIVLGQAEHT